MQLGLSQTELGQKVGITFQQIQKYEKGANRIGSSRLQQIADALQVAPAYLFENPLADMPRRGEDLDLAELDKFLCSRDGIDLMQAFVKIKSEALRRIIAELVDDLGD